MRFLLEFVSCCGCRESSRGVRPEEEPSKTEETKTLVSSIKRNYRRRRRGRFGGGVQSEPAEWKPSLFAIMEDNVVMELEKKKSETERVTKRKSGVSHKSRPRVRNYGFEFGGSSLAPVFPAFSATPFMF
ncbi:hypothetical protein LWI28_008040 [Acer negundo]|uniref:Uncharacterized protein n=1 Tax=Acer negundo TaxID=4023 RepID=A0AAD5J4D7_ACENE|nr:hypothetical protein LWI28_008040 [Acer negundo]KAK4851087.1 hypothetical protein QYF36_012330 [Acer negundo]